MPSVASTGLDPAEATPSLVQHTLQPLHDRALRTFGEGRRLGAAATERGPGGRPDDAVDGEVARALELLDGRCGHRPENAVDLLIAQRLADDHEQVLRPLTVGPAAPWEMVPGVVPAGL